MLVAIFIVLVLILIAIMCAVVLVWLTDRAADAQWLKPEQREWLGKRLAQERAHRESIHRFELGEALRNPRVWWLTLVYFGQNVSNYGLLIFLPQIIGVMGQQSIAPTSWSLPTAMLSGAATAGDIGDRAAGAWSRSAAGAHPS